MAPVWREIGATAKGLPIKLIPQEFLPEAVT
jgi:hypothetical protein